MLTKTQGKSKIIFNKSNQSKFMKTILRLKKPTQIQILSTVDSLQLKGGRVVKGIDNLESEVD